MAIGDILATLNPMDFVTGMEKGFKLGQTRAEEERLKAQAATETLKSEEFAREDERRRRLLETQLGATTADLGKALRTIELQIAQEQSPLIKESLIKQQENIRDAARLRGFDLGGQLERAPGQQRMMTEMQAQTERLFPQIKERREAQFNLDGLVRAAEANNTEAKIRLESATRGANDLMRAVMGDPANREIARDPYAVAEVALKRVQDPDQRAYLIATQDRIAKEMLAQNINYGPGLALWLPRAHPGMQAEPVAGDPTRIKITRTTYVESVDPATQQTVRQPKVDSDVFTLDVNNKDYGRTQQFFAGLTGQKVPFIQPYQAGREAPGTTTPGQAGAALVGGGGANVGPPAPAAPGGGAATPRPAAAAPAAAAPAAPPPPPDPLAAQNAELDAMERRVADVRRTLPGQAATKHDELIKAIEQLRQRGQPVKPALLDQLRQLVDQTAPPRGNENVFRDIGVSIGRMFEPPQQVPAEQTIQQLLTPR